MKSSVRIAFLFSLLIFCLILSVLVTATWASDWERIIGGTELDEGYSVQQTADGGYIIAGRTRISGNLDVYLIKTDENGEIGWEKTFGGSYDDQAHSVQQTDDDGDGQKDDGYIIVGRKEKSDDGYPWCGDCDVYLIKTDVNGNIVREKTFSGRGQADGRAVQQTEDGGYIIVGWTRSDGAEDDVYLIKTYANGDIEWEKTFGGLKEDKGRSVQQTADGGYVIAGWTGGDVYLIKTNENGIEQWYQTFGGLEEDRGHSVQQTDDGGYIIVGETYSYGSGGDVYLIKTDADGNQEWITPKTFGGLLDDSGFSIQQTDDDGDGQKDDGYIIAGEGNYDPIAFSFDAFLIKTNKNGSKEWYRKFNRTNSEWFGQVQQTTDGGYIMIGGTSPLPDRDVYLVKISADGSNAWEQTFGGTAGDYGYSIQQTNDCGYIITGRTESYGAGNGDVYLIKTDGNGNNPWENTFGGSYLDVGRSVQQTIDNGYIIAGLTESYGAGGKDIYLIKTDENGNNTWEKTFGGSGDDWGTSVQQTDVGGFIISGWTSSFGAGGDDVYLIKTDKNGNNPWEKTFGGFGDDTSHSSLQTADGGYIIAGNTDPYLTGSKDIYLIKTDENGNEIWSKTFGGAGDDQSRSIRQTEDGGYVIAGWTSSYGSGGYDVYLIKTDENGNKIWDNTFGGPEEDKGFSVQQTEDGGYVIAGWTSSYGSGGYDVYFIKTDENGDIKSEKTFGGVNDDQGYSVQQTSDGGYVIIGYTASYGAGGSDVYIIKTFEGYPNLPVRINTSNPLYYSTLQEAYDASVDGDTIQSKTACFTEDLNVDGNKMVNLEGGYNFDYTVRVGQTILNGMMSVSNGMLTIGNFVLE